MFVSYYEALDNLYSLSKFGIKLGLERIEKLLERLKNPQEHLKIIHITGSKGKGSTSIFLTKILMEQGFKVGLFISPSLELVNERISINGSVISPKKFIETYNKVWHIIKKVEAEDPVTFFEALTAIAFQYFYDEKVDFLILEVGLGGLYDATNVIKNPLLSIITHITYEHQDRLGDTLSQIAFQKAGIIKSGVPVISSPQEEEALEVLKQVAIKKESPIFINKKDFYSSLKEAKEDFSLINFSFKSTNININFENLKSSLIGLHQVNNAANAVAASILLKHFYKIPIKEQSIYKGIQKTFWAGRLEIINKNPLIILDGAHTETAARALKLSIEKYFPQKSMNLLIGILKDKNIEGILKNLIPFANKTVITEVPDSDRSADPDFIYEISRKFLEDKKIYKIRDYKSALEFTINNTKPDEVLVVTGSLYLAGAIRSLFNLFTFSQ